MSSLKELVRGEKMPGQTGQRGSVRAGQNSISAEIDTLNQYVTNATLMSGRRSGPDNISSAFGQTGQTGQTGQRDLSLAKESSKEASKEKYDNNINMVYSSINPFESSLAYVVRPDMHGGRLRAALAAFRDLKPRGIARLRHNQACWAAEMFLQEWESLAIEFEWTAEDIFALPRAGCRGLAYWLGMEIVRSLGPEHAVGENGRVFDRVTWQTWVNPYKAETKQ